LQADIAQAKAAVKLNADDTEAKAKLTALKKEASNLRGQIDLDTAPARAEIAKLKAEANRGKVTVQAEADTAKAEAQLAKVAGDRTANIRVDDQGSILSSTNRLGALLTAGVALGPAIVPAAAAAAAAVGAIGVGALAGVAGIGTLVLGFSGVGDAVKALGAAQTSAGRDAAKSAASQVAAAEQIRSAEASLANVRANSNDSAVRSARAVADAQQGVRDATREAARSVQDALGAQATAQRGVEDAARSAAASVRSALRQQVDAQRAVEDATRSATRSVADALFAQENAEQSLAQAQRDARTAQLSLTQAREDARQSLEDLTLQVEDGALAQRRAVLGVQEAQAALNDVMVDPKATQRQRDLAQLAYDEAAQNLEQIGVRNRRLAAEKAAADKAGIEGSRQVQAATAGIATAEQRVEDARTQAARAADAVSEARRAGDERVMVAQQRLADSTVAIAEAQRAGEERVAAARAQLAKAEQGVADARVAADRRVADAQARVSEAVASQAQQQRASAFAISQAQAAVATAHRQAATAAEAQSSSLTKVDDAMKALTPAGRTFALFLFSLRHRFDELKATAQEGLLPGVQAGIQAVLPLLPVLNRIVGNAAKAMGDLFEQAGKALTSPFWMDFFNMIATTVGPNLRIFGQTLLNLGQGFAGLLMAFQPLNAQLGSGLLNLSQRFAEFGAQARSSAGFQAFMDYVQQVGPLVVSVFRSLAVMVGRVLVALAPVGPIVLKSIGVLAEIVNGIPIDVLQVLLVTIGALVLGFRVWAAAAVWLVNIAMNANPISLIVIGLVPWVRPDRHRVPHSRRSATSSTHAWAGIQAATAATWRVIGPILSSIARWVGTFLVAAFHLWVRVVRAEFAAVQAVTATLWRVVGPIFSTLYRWVGTVLVGGFRLYTRVVRAEFNAAGAVISAVWRNVLHPVFDALGRIISRTVPDAFTSGVRAIKSAWDKIKDAAKARPVRHRDGPEPRHPRRVQQDQRETFGNPVKPSTRSRCRRGSRGAPRTTARRSPTPTSPASGRSPKPVARRTSPSPPPSGPGPRGSCATSPNASGTASSAWPTAAPSSPPAATCATSATTSRRARTGSGPSTTSTPPTPATTTAWPSTSTTAPGRRRWSRRPCRGSCRTCRTSGCGSSSWPPATTTTCTRRCRGRRASARRSAGW
jgi:hypothetical protein